jgi:hypothetical protein
MKLNTGKVAFPIEFENGTNVEKDVIYFNPNDPDLALRLRKLQESVRQKIGDMSDIELNPDGTPSDASNIETFEKIQKIMFEEIDCAFGGNISSVVFKYCSPFAFVDGEFFLVSFINAIIPEIESHIKKTTEDIEKKMSKHIEKYQR